MPEVRLPFRQVRKNEEKEKGELMDELRNEGGIVEGEQSQPADPPPWISFMYLNFPYIYSYVNAGCVPAGDRIGVLQ